MHFLVLRFLTWTPHPPVHPQASTTRLALCRNAHVDTPMNRKGLLRFIFKIQIFLLINFLGFFSLPNDAKGQMPGFHPV